MATNVVPLTDHIILQPVEQEEITTSGLVIPDSAKEAPQHGHVISVGPGKLNDSGTVETIELASGQSFVIAGLISQSTSENLSKTPGIGDIPILGALFKSEQFRREETELIIIVTPYLVRPISDQMIPLPTDPFTREPASASGAQKVSTSQIVPVPIGASSATGQTSSAGYILD